ncbi:MAG: hypothetical protein ACJAYY_003085 [Paraglaciecola sp.]|jgi:hypothetical protein|uniref:hypothetical protein n=1 Tax=Polaribacter sp. TaxID=1920175 RepID=UPI003AE4A05C
MIKLGSIITIIAISLATTFSTTAAEKEPSKITKNLRIEIVSMLGDKIPIEVTETSSAEISFMINNENEIVILSIDSKVIELSNFVKSKLNYKKVKVRGTLKGEIYKMPLKINVK